MDYLDIALQLTLKALEHGYIKFDTYGYSEKKDIEDSNDFNAKQLSDFYLHTYNQIIADDEPL